MDLRDPKKYLLQSANTTPEAFKGLEVGFIYPQSMPHYRYYVVDWSYECALYCLLFVRQETLALIAVAMNSCQRRIFLCRNRREGDTVDSYESSLFAISALERSVARKSLHT